jgi:hypothetical protein
MQHTNTIDNFFIEKLSTIEKNLIYESFCKFIKKTKLEITDFDIHFYLDLEQYNENKIKFVDPDVKWNKNHFHVLSSSYSPKAKYRPTTKKDIIESFYYTYIHINT